MSTRIARSIKSLFSFAALSAAVFLLSQCNPPAPNNTTAYHGSQLVRGYIAAAVGKSAKAEKSGIYARGFPGKNIYLPGVDVYAEDPNTHKSSGVVRTDLSGRFTLMVPGPGRYHLCWKSSVYGSGCMQDIFSAGREPLFLSTLLIDVPRKKGFIASFGKVRFKDGSMPRTLDPLADVNAFPVVSVFDKDKKLLAKVPVNNFGDYLLPYVPVPGPANGIARLVATIEKAEGVQVIDFTGGAAVIPQVVRYHLTIKNTPPRLDAIAPTGGAGKRVQVGTLGDTLVLKAVTRDRDGDPVQVQWSESPGSGTLSSKTGNQIKWDLPKTPGRYSVQAIASDGKGGYDRYTVRLSVGTPGVPFSGVVVGTGNVLLKDAEVEINRATVKTDAQGRFLLYVPEAERYVFNIRKKGYGFYSKIYDRSVAGGRWTLTRATTTTFDPKFGVTFTDKRDERNCPGPDSARINWNQGPALKQVWWQDGKGNNIAPPIGKKDKLGPILPWEKRADKQRYCGPGISVKIPPNALETESGGAPANVDLSLSTVDLNTPEQMPGDDGVERPGPTPDWMQSYGAGMVDLRDAATGQPLKLKAGMQAEVTIPVDPGQLAAGGPLPATMPLLFYNEIKGIWIEDGKLTLDAAKKNYVAKVSHFSNLNTDLVKTDPSCVRVQSTITPPYDIEVTIPLPGGAAPKLKKTTITDAPPHVIYHLPNNTNITIVAIAPGSGSTPPRSLGVFVVDTGPPQAAGFGAPPPASACATEVTLSEQTFPTAPASGEFLHGLFSFAGTVINEADIPTAGTLSQQLDQATINYYNQIDPNGDRETLTEFRTKNNFTHPPGFALCSGSVCDNPDDEINVVFANSGDLGFGRDMHCRRTDTGAGTGYDYACYVSNYGDITTDDTLDAENASTNTGLIATVAMEYSRILDTDALTDRHVKFYVYNAAGDRVNNADLDGVGKRPIPQLCMVCHGGAYPGGGTTGVPSFNTPDSVKLGSRFIPFDIRFYTFPAAVDKTAQQSGMKHLNQDIVQNAPSLPAPDPVADIVAGMYAGGSATQLENFVVPGWQSSEQPLTAAQEAFYKRVLANACRSCHVTQPFANVSNERAGVDLQFRSALDFLRNQTITTGGSLTPLSAAEGRVCTDYVMPHARRTFDILWQQYWEDSFGVFNPTLIGQFQSFGETMKNLPTPAGWTDAWPPAWNGHLCGEYTGAGSTPPSFYSTMVHPLWSRNYSSSGSVLCTNCHSGLSGLAADSYNALLTGAGDSIFSGAMVIPNNSAGSRLVGKLRGTASGSRMPLGCPSGTTRCLNEAGGVYNPAADPDPNSTTHEVDRVIYWIDNGAAP